MKIFSDFHHSGAARGQVLLLQVRLGNPVFFGDERFVTALTQRMGTRRVDWLPVLPSWLAGMGGVPKDILNDDLSWPNLINFEEFMDMDWDVFLCTRIETQDVFKELKRLHPRGDKVKIIGVTGNDATPFDWTFIRNLMTSDEATYRLSPWDINKIHYSQEIGWDYGIRFTPVDERSLRTVNCFVNCWTHFDDPWVWGYDNNLNRGCCPHCDNPPSKYPEAVRPFSIWKGAEAKLPGHLFVDYGIACKMGCIPEVEMPLAYASGALTVHMKTYDGYGYSMLQSIACGRPVIVPYKFHRYRTANKYLIPNLTCFEVDWNAESLAQTIGYVTENVKRANEYAVSCWQAAKGLFNWDHEAFRVREFLERLV
jgi:glycosyltransferase involved in cell wall biosynthesis